MGYPPGQSCDWDTGACPQVWKEQSLLLCLVEEGLTAFRLPSFRMASQAGRTRGANRFALDLERSIVCVAAKKRLLLFHFDGNDFVELKELGLPDIVMDMAWCGDSVCLAFKRECVPPQPSVLGPPCSSLPFLSSIGPAFASPWASQLRPSHTWMERVLQSFRGLSPSAGRPQPSIE